MRDNAAVLAIFSALLCVFPAKAPAQDRVVELVFPDARLQIGIGDGLLAKVTEMPRRPGRKVIQVVLPKSVHREFGSVTTRNVGKNIQLLVGCETVVDTVLREPILGGVVVISGDERETAIDAGLDAKAALINAGGPPCERK